MDLMILQQLQELKLLLMLLSQETCLSLQCNSGNSFLYANGVKVYHFKAKDSETTNDFTADPMKKIGLNGKVYRVSVDYNTIDIGNIVAIHKYLMKNHNIL